MPEGAVTTGPVPDAGPTSSSTTHEIRITTGGKISNWVEFALKFLKDSPDAVLVLHTLPLDLKGKGKAPPPTATDDTSGAQEQPQPPANADTGKSQTLAKKRSGMQPSTNAISKLISVAEIIKREYLKLADDALVGLYQYNELGTLEDLGLASQPQSEEDADLELARSQAIIQALDGVKNVRIQRTPYMRITLSPKEVSDLAAVTHPATAQRPEKRQLSKSAKGRLKKRLKKSADASVAPGAGAGAETAGP
ncbi:hypothetical protein PENSPDRAFT_680085 [Peniophora sp. CONT]|nr:hypothetical protein PENSPDRAFT_680085 [Peniophora sp. CONT]